MPMPTIKEIENAVTRLKEVQICYGHYKCIALETIFDLAESILTAEWPEKRNNGKINFDVDELSCGWQDGYNTAIDACLADHLRKMAELREACKIGYRK